MIPRRSLGWMAALAMLGGSACSSDSAEPAGNGGAPGSGGAASSGGSGGSTRSASGGSSATGGRTGAGGASSTAAGSGGAGAGGTSKGSGGSGSVTSGGSSGFTGSGGSSASTGKGGSSGSGGNGGSTGGSGGSSGGSATTAGGGAGRDGGAGTGGSSGGSTTGDAGSGTAVPSAGCSKTPTLKNSASSTNFTPNTVTAGGKSRQYVIRWPDDYSNTHPYRLILDLHGAGGSYSETAGSYFGLWSLSKSSTIFIALSADGGYWSATSDLTYVDEVLTAVEADLCIDTSRIMLEGFSQGAAMSWVLACSRPGVFRADVGHSGGGVTNPTTCDPIAYLGSLGLSDISGNSQKTQTDQFAKWNGCTVETLPTASTGSHVCTAYKGCPADKPVIWCSYDGGHTASPTDSGQSSSWMPSEVWPFMSQF